MKQIKVDWPCWYTLSYLQLELKADRSLKSYYITTISYYKYIQRIYAIFLELQIGVYIVMISSHD